jgi:hypothetical protein
VPREAGEVLRRGLAKDPDQRFANITEFARALLSGAGSSLPPPESMAVAQTIPAAASDPQPVLPTKPRPSPRYQTGTQAKTPADPTATTVANGFSTHDLTVALDRARQAHDLGDIELAVNNAETALLVADALGSPEASARLESSRTLLSAIFEARLGPLSRRMVVLAPASNKKLRVSPEQAFLLSRVDGGVTLDEAIDLSPLSRQKTLRLLVSMLRQGLIAAQ